MLNREVKHNFNIKIIGGLVFAFLIFTAYGCQTNSLPLGEPAATAAQTPQANPEPIVVNGVRTSYADVVDKTSPAVVRIESQIKANASDQSETPFGDNDFFKQFGIPAPRQNQKPQIERGLGSGVIVSADGMILTNYHVINGAEKITVQTTDNKSLIAKVIGTDQPSDLAVIKIEGESLPFLSLGNSDNVRIGDIVLAIGNPLGIGQTVTAGIISAKGRRTGLSDGSFEDFLQTDAPINRGNSGGALVNLNGELIGINSQILSSGGSGGGSIGIGFSIPSNMAKSVMDQLVKSGKVSRGQLGVNIQPLTPEIARALDLNSTDGVIVSGIKAGSAADKAGVKRGDIITAINGEKVDDGNVLRNKVAQTPPGSVVKLTIVRDGSRQELSVTLDESAPESAKTENPSKTEGQSDKGQSTGKLGLSLQPLTPQIAKQLGIASETEGLVVTEVDPNGAAAEQGVGQGDVILEVNRQAVKSLDDVRSALEKSGDKPILLLISRKGQTIYLTVAPH